MVVVKHQRRDGITDTLLRTVPTKKPNFTKPQVRVWNDESVTILDKMGDFARICTRNGKKGYLQLKHLDIDHPEGVQTEHLEVAEACKEEEVSKDDLRAKGRQWVKLFPGGYACYFGSLTAFERDGLVARFRRNRQTDHRGYSLGLGRKLISCEKEMSDVMWIPARCFRDAQATESLKLGNYRLRSWFNEKWCTKWARTPHTPDHDAFHNFCKTGAFVVPSGRVALKRVGIPAGIIPCCTTPEGEAMILLGRDAGGWSCFLGGRDKTDKSEWDTAVREAAEEACECFGNSEELKLRFFSGAWVA